ncbi:sigma factor-like helix-turn-helix DNA-binding protein [Thermithiobacillus plumbiphilus]|uniref:Sigma factor-like helix-turn-helix DNA-binding protein n=1 Tax=Thermithiobacillus plumbiphilus TaxID=1729899 RepID=A0ABU9D9F1_9PROT
MIHLLAYLLVRRPDGSWSVSSHRNLEGMMEEWDSVRAINDKSSAIIHVGFWRPDTSIFETACLRDEGKVFLTGAARFALPSSYRSSSNPVLTEDGLPIYLALSGWGYVIEEDPTLHADQIPVMPMLAPPDRIPSCPIDWIKTLEEDDPDLFSECAKLFILSEALYEKRESLMPPTSRNRLAGYRFKQFFGHPPSRDNMVDGLKFAPPWILQMPVNTLNFPVRVRNRMAAVGANIVSDIARIGAAGLMRIDNLGRKSLMDISVAIFEAFEQGSTYCASTGFLQGELLEMTPPAEPKQGKAPKILDKVCLEATPMANSLEPQSFRDGLQAALSLLSEREASVLQQRMGIGGSRKTLEEIAKSYSLTRERVRQIESKAASKIIARMPMWVGSFRSSLVRMLDGRETPLPLLGLDILDSWFAGIETLFWPFEYSIGHLIEPPEFDIIRIAGQAYVSRLRQDEWDEAVRAAKTLLSTCAKSKSYTPESEVRLLVECQLVGKGEELRQMLWEVATSQAHFSVGPLGERLLVSFGMSAESVVEAILLGSDTPLHYSEIAKRCVRRGHNFDLRRAHNAAANVGFLLGRGIYGLEKHIELSKGEQERILAEVEDMLSEAPGRQWHAGEICDALEARSLDFEGRLSKYDLNVILGSSTTLAYLGRMVWVARTHHALGTADRMNIWQKIVILVQQHGSPMHASDIREIISRDRGLASFFQIHQADPLIRVGENEWGILWRDIPFDEIQANAIVDEMISILDKNGFGIHLSEIISSLTVNHALAAKANPILLVALATRSELVKSGKGGYIYLTEWEGPRRLTIGEAVERAFDTFTDGVLAADVANKASELLGREVANNAASSVLMKIGTYNLEKGLWFHYEESAEALEDPTDVVMGESYPPPLVYRS